MTRFTTNVSQSCIILGSIKENINSSLVIYFNNKRKYTMKYLNILKLIMPKYTILELKILSK